MSIKRTMVRLILMACGVGAIGSILAAFHYKGAVAVETWLVVAAALAVVVSLLSAWSAHIAVELQEDQMKPDVIVYLDVKDRYQLMQLRMRNRGRSTAFDILDHWDVTPTDYTSKNLKFAYNDVAVTRLLPDETLSKRINTPSGFFKSYAGERYTVTVQFKDGAGRKYKQKFIIDPSQYAETLTYDQEELRTHFELQQIPEKLDELKIELQKMNAIMQHRGETREGKI